MRVFKKPTPNQTSIDRLKTAVTEINNVLSDLVGEFTVAHLEAAEKWEDRLECLTWAVESRATVAEMKAWRRSKNGWDLFSDARD